MAEEKLPTSFKDYIDYIENIAEWNLWEMYPSNGFYIRKKEHTNFPVPIWDETEPPTYASVKFRYYRISQEIYEKFLGEELSYNQSRGKNGETTITCTPVCISHLSDSDSDSESE